MKTKRKILSKLFFSTLCLSAFTFGGGYVIVTLMKKKFVDDFKWIDEQEMLDLVAIAQSAPGAIAINGAVIVGYKLAGILGVVVSVVATILPPFFIITVISFFYQLFQSNIYVKLVLDGMQAGVCAVIADVVYDMGRDVAASKSKMSIIIMIIAFIATYVFRINVIYIVLICIIIGMICTLCKMRRKV